MWLIFYYYNKLVRWPLFRFKLSSILIFYKKVFLKRFLANLRREGMSDAYLDNISEQLNAIVINNSSLVRYVISSDVPMPLADQVSVFFNEVFDSVYRYIWWKGQYDFWHIHDQNRYTTFTEKLVVYTLYLFSLSGHWNSLNVLFGHYETSEIYSKFIDYLKLDIKCLKYHLDAEKEFYVSKGIYLDAAIFELNESVPDLEEILEDFSTLEKKGLSGSFLYGQLGQFHERTGDIPKARINYQLAFDSNSNNVAASLREKACSLLLAKNTNKVLENRSLVNSHKTLYLKIYDLTTLKDYSGPSHSTASCYQQACHNSYEYKAFYADTSRTINKSIALPPRQFRRCQDILTSDYGSAYSHNQFIEGTKWLGRPNIKCFTSRMVSSAGTRAVIGSDETLESCSEAKNGAMLISGMFQNYYHFLLDILPAILHFHRENPDKKILIPGKSLGWQIDILSKAGIDEKSLHFFGHPHKTYLLEDVTLYEPSSSMNFSNPKAIASTRQKLSRHGTARPGKRICMIRKNTLRKTLSNSIEIEKELTKGGFRIIDTGSMSFDEQLDIFADCEMVIAPAGAALTNLLFCPEGCKVLLTAPVHHYGETFTSLAGALKQPATVCLGNDHLVPLPYYLWSMRPYTVDSTTFRHALFELLDA